MTDLSLLYRNQSHVYPSHYYIFYIYYFFVVNTDISDTCVNDSHNRGVQIIPNIVKITLSSLNSTFSKKQ